MTNNAAVVCIDLSSSSSSDDDHEDEEELEILPPKSQESSSSEKKSRADDEDDDDAVMAPYTFNRNKRQAVESARFSDDDDLLPSEGPTFATVHPRKLTQREQREEEKRRDKEQRHEERQQKLLYKQQEQELKKRRVEQAQQQMGKYANREIVILIHRRLYQQLMNGDCSEVVEGLEELNKVHACTTSLPATNAIQWIRQDYLLGGAEQALKSYNETQQDENSAAKSNKKTTTSNSSLSFQQMDRLALLFYDPATFLALLQRDDEHDDDYPKLAAYVEPFLTTKHRHYDGKLIFILFKVQDEISSQWNAHKGRRSSTTTAAVPPPTHAEFNDCMVWLMVCYGVECIVCNSEDELLSNLQKLTRAQSEAKYQQPVTELECVKKLKSDTSMNTSSPYEKAHDTWIRQLQQVPGISDAKARHLASYVPTQRCLWELYQDPSRTEQEKRMIVAPLLHEGRNFPKLSDTLYRLLTSTNADELL